MPEVCVSSTPIDVPDASNTLSVAGTAYFFARAKFLPRVQTDKEFRWDYDYVEIGDPQDGGYSMLDIYEEFHPQNDSDEWTIGSSSSYSSGGRSPSAGTRSPVDDAQSLWEGDTLASDNEQSR